MPVSRYRKHILRDGERTIRKSVSCEPLLDLSSSDDEDRTGGARLTCASLTPSPAGKRLFIKKSASEAARSRPGSADSFQVGANTDDDVFAEDDDSGLSSSGVSFVGPEDDDHYLEPGVSSVDAQGIYPPTACIFAANLAQMYDDKTLEYEVTRAFSKFGSVFVKIRRDSRQMPFALMNTPRMPIPVAEGPSFLDAHVASRWPKPTVSALPTSLGVVILITVASFVVYKHSGDFISVDEAVELLSTIGEVAKAEQLDIETQQAMRLPPAIVANYKMYDPKRDAPASFRGHRRYKVIPYDSKVAANGRPGQASPDKEHFLNQYDRDRRSVYMGNLPMNMTEETLTNLVSACGGEVLGVVLFKKPVPGSPSKMTCFAFVEFSRPDTADDAITAFNDKDINGFRVRVDRKQSRTFETPRRGLPIRSANYSHSTFPRRRQAPLIEPVSPLHTMFDPPAGYKKPAVVHQATEHGAPAVDLDQTPKTAEETGTQTAAASEGNLFTPTPKRSHDGGNVNDAAFAYGNMETPVAMQHHQHVPMHMGWMPPFPAYPYGPPMSPYGPMTPHGTPGVMYPGYSPGHYYPGMFPDMFPMASPPHMMPPPPQMAAPMPAQAHAPAVQAAEVVPAELPGARLEGNQAPPSEHVKEEK
ncbi:hypothetical protein PWT90_03339 [Aphanocladium album]|nr:hypothetical protein PWT90_03339 [Aphanocladium album]